LLGQVRLPLLASFFLPGVYCPFELAGVSIENHQALSAFC
jgi:hypothetical protein